MSEAKIYDKVVGIGVDLQVDFCPGGNLGVEEGDKTVPPFNEAARWIRAHGGQVIFTRDKHPRVTSHFDEWPPHCIDGTPGFEFHPGLRVLPQDIIISKGMGADEDAFSGFDGITDDGRTLEEIIRGDKEMRVAVFAGGLTTEYCFDATEFGALSLARKMKEEYGATLDVYGLSDAIRPVNFVDGAKAIIKMSEAGVQFISSRALAEDEIIQVGSHW